MIDSIKVYVKTKDAFGWPEDESAPEPLKLQTASDVSSTGAFLLSTAHVYPESTLVDRLEGYSVRI